MLAESLQEINIIIHCELIINCQKRTENCRRGWPDLGVVRTGFLETVVPELRAESSTMLRSLLEHSLDAMALLCYSVLYLPF